MTSLDDSLGDDLSAGLGEAPAPDFADVERRARRQTRRARILGAGSLAAASLLVAGVTLTIIDGDEGPADLVTEPDAGTTSTTLTTDGSRSTTTSTTTTAPEPPAPGPRPARVLVATEDGQLLVLDVSTGDVATRMGTFDVNLDPPEGSPNFVDDVAITADGAMAYISRCCEPASGWISSIPADGSIPLDLYSTEQHFTTATAVRPGPPSRPLLALSVYDGIDVTSGDPYPADVRVEGGELYDGLAWSPDGSRLVWQEFTGNAIVVAEVRGEDDVEVIARFTFPGRVRWHQPAFRRDGAIVVVEQPDGGDDPGTTARVLDAETGESVTTFSLPGPTISLGYDPTGTWLLVLLQDGRLYGMGGGETIPIADGVTAADW